MLAIAVMRTRFASSKEVWELQGQKGLDYLASHGLAMSDIDIFVDRAAGLIQKPERTASFGF